MCAVRRRAVGVALSLGLSLAAAGSATAQDREFTGRIDRVDAQTLVVDNRMGDQMTFERLDGTAVEGQKRSWRDLRPSDRVTVDWKMADRPRKAYRVHVLPPKEGEGER